MVSALNLARMQQLEGRWRDSIKTYDAALFILEEYERRAVINMRAVLGSVGSVTLARGSGGYYGTGYERSLLHTMNALNYIMLGDFAGAAVEMRRMEMRQELWLEEKEHRLRAAVEAAQRNKSASYGTPDYNETSLPPGYSMGQILSSPEIRSMAGGYQDPFSYALSSVLCRIAGDRSYADISLRRACLLSDMANGMFRQAWGAGQNTARAEQKMLDTYGWLPQTPPLPSKNISGQPMQEVTLLMLGGVGPALKMEQLRVPNVVTGYVLIDLPAYEPPVPARFPSIEVPGNDFKLYSLLRSDVLAYRELYDELSYEISASVARAVTRAALASGGFAAGASKDDSKFLAPVLGLMLSMGMDKYAEADAKNVRNWETLPAAGYMGLFSLPRGAAVDISFAGKTRTVSLPETARGVVIVVSQVETSNVRVDYAAY